MRSELKSTLFATVAEVFETMFFSYLDLVEETNHWPDLQLEIYMEASIGLSGKDAGAVHFYFSKSLAYNIAANFLGVSKDELSEEKVADVLGETANMSIGSLLGKLESHLANTSLSIPTVQNTAGLTFADIVGQPNVMAFSTQHGPLLLEYGVIEMCCEA